MNSGFRTGPTQAAFAYILCTVLRALFLLPDIVFPLFWVPRFLQVWGLDRDKEWGQAPRPAPRTASVPACAESRAASRSAFPRTLASPWIAGLLPLGFRLPNRTTLAEHCVHSWELWVLFPNKQPELSVTPPRASAWPQRHPKARCLEPRARRACDGDVSVVATPWAGCLTQGTYKLKLHPMCLPGLRPTCRKSGVSWTNSRDNGPCPICHARRMCHHEQPTSPFTRVPSVPESCLSISSLLSP